METPFNVQSAIIAIRSIQAIACTELDKGPIVAIENRLIGIVNETSQAIAIYRQEGPHTAIALRRILDNATTSGVNDLECAARVLAGVVSGRFFLLHGIEDAENGIRVSVPIRKTGSYAPILHPEDAAIFCVKLEALGVPFETFPESFQAAHSLEQAERIAKIFVPGYF